MIMNNLSELVVRQLEKGIALKVRRGGGEGAILGGGGISWKRALP